MKNRFIPMLACLSCFTYGYAALEVAGVFSDSMVLQRDIRVPVWGWAAIGETVTISMNGQTKIAAARDSTIAAYKGYWKIWLDPMSAGGPFDMTISGSSSASITIKNILIGDVWICSGQSNMNYSLPGLFYTDNTQEMQTLPPSGSPITQIRMCRVGPSYATNPVLDLKKTTTWDNVDQQITAPWRSCSRENSSSFSGIGALFGIMLYKKTSIPVGLISAAVGGSSIKSWLRAEVADTVAYRLCGNKPDTTVRQRTPVRFSQGWANGIESGALYSGMISPLAGLGIKGIIWWQGESDVIDKTSCYYTAEGFRRLITDWRKRWGQGDFCFIYNQLQQCLDDVNTAINDVRDKQMQALDLPNTGMSVSFDSSCGIHPGGRMQIAGRMVSCARALAYGENIEYLGPIYKGMTIEGNHIRISFAHISNGLTKHTTIQWQGNNDLAVGSNVLSSSADPNAPFEIAGADNVFYKADAVIDNNTVVVSSDKVSTPKNVRYGIEIPARAKTPLYNDSNLPASMFRTNTWAGLGNLTTEVKYSGWKNRAAAGKNQKVFIAIDNRNAFLASRNRYHQNVDLFTLQGQQLRQPFSESAKAKPAAKNCRYGLVIVRSK